MTAKGSKIISNEERFLDDKEWYEDVTSHYSMVDGILSFKGKEIIIDVSGFDSNDMEKLYHILKPYVIEGGYDGPDLWWDNGCFKIDNFVNSHVGVISLHCGIEDNDFKPVKGLICCLNSVDEALRTLQEGDYMVIDGKFLLSSKNINESEDEFDWVPREVDLNNPEVLFTVIDDVLKNTNFKIVKSTNPFSVGGGVTYHIEDEYGDTYIYINEQDFNLPFIYHNIRDNLSFLRAEEDNDLIPYYRRLLNLIRPLYTNNIDILFKPIKESEEDEFDWVRDVINGLDHYEKWDGETQLSDDTFLVIDGEWDSLEFHNQPAKIVRVSSPEDHAYLLVFPQVLEAYEQTTHCGNIEDFSGDVYKCHCEDTDSQRGRCWYVPLWELSEVKVFPNRKGFLGESKEENFDWIEDYTKYLDVGQKFKINRRGSDGGGFIAQIVSKAHNNVWVSPIDMVSKKYPGTPINVNRLLKLMVNGHWTPIDGIIENMENKPLLTEGRYDAITRKVVKDIMNVVIQTRGRNDELHQALLPNAMREDEFEYSQEGLSFSIELNVHHQHIFETRPADKESDAYYVHTAIADDDENIIMMTVVVDPAWEPRIYERLFYKLQEDIRHEIEHFTQMGPNRISDRPKSKTDTANLKTTYGHHKNKIEVPALVHGFYRRAKLEKRPLDDIMIEDLDSEIERGNLSPKQAKKLLQIWVDYAKKNLPHAQYSNLQY